MDASTAWSALAQGKAPDISIWLIRQGQRPVEDLARKLCPAERALLASFAAAEAAQEYAAAHSALRHLVGRALGQRPEAVLFAHPGDRLRPPVLRDTDGLFPSLSHSGGFVAVALRRGGPVGVDIEPVDRAAETASIHQQFLSEIELAALDRMPRIEVRAHCLALWCAKEAALKAAGTGFSTDPRGLTLTGCGDPAVAVAVQRARRYFVRTLAVQKLAGIEGAVAAKEADPTGTLCLTDLDWVLNQR